MRSVIGLALMGLGVFALAAAALTRFYIAPQMIAAPQNVYQVTHLQAQNATYFDASKGQTRNGATVTVTDTLRGDSKAARGDIVVWDNATVIEDLANNARIEISKQRLAFDRRTGQLTRCCGTYVGDDKQVSPTGISMLWPVNLERKDYPFFDSTTKRAWPMKYSGTEKVEGITAYKFVQTIPATKTPDPAPEVPANLLGLPGSNPVIVDRYQQSTVTYWVDPRSGVPVNYTQQVRSSLRSQDGQGELVVADLNLNLTAKSKADLLDRVNDSANQILLIKIVLPLVLLVLGVLLLGGGVLAGRGNAARHRRRGTDTQEEAVPAKS